MGRNKGVVGSSYEVAYPEPGLAKVTFTYRCPYCRQETTVQEEYTDNLDILEKGVFYEPLSCGHCGKTADVRYLPHNKIV